jgi:hypothetical protein
MNNTFSITRFGWLLKKTMGERPVQLAGFMIIAMAVSFMIYVFFKLVGDFETAQNASFMLGMIGGGSFLASLVFNYFSTNASGVSFLTLPASQFEKWLCGILIVGVGFVGMFLLFFRTMDFVFVTLYHNALDPKGPFYRQFYDAVQLFQFDSFLASRAYMMFFNFAGAMLLGSFYFNKAAFIKTALILVAVFFGGTLLNLLIAHLYFDNAQNAFPFFLVWLYVGNDTARLELPRSVLSGINIFFLFILPVALWLLSCLRLKEKEF